MPNQFFSPDGDLENYFVTEYWLIDQYIGDKLWVWGLNGTYGRLGINNTLNRSTPVTTFAGGTNWRQVSGESHIAAIKTDGTLWAWGAGGFGELGNNNTPNRSTPVTTFAGGNNWKQVDTGFRCTAAIKTDGTLWTWGNGTNGVLGNNNIGFRSTPVTTFAGGNNWKQLSCGYQTTAAIKTDGTLWVWGNNSSGQLGINATTNRSTPVTTFAGGTNWKQVSCGGGNMGAIKTDGTLWVWGSGSFGALGTNTVSITSTPVTTFAGGTNWKQFSSVGSSMVALKTDGTLWTWGYNSYGRLGINDNIRRSTPVTTFAGGTNWKQVSCGTNMGAIKTDGTLWVWGQNNNGQLGINNTSSRSTPVTTFAGGTNWKQVNILSGATAAVQSGIDETLSL